MSWLQVYTLGLRCYEHVAASGRVVYVIQLRFGQQDDSRATDLTKRSYSEFRTLWKDLLRATSGGLDDSDHIRLFPNRESWSNVSKLLSGTFGGGRGRGTRRRESHVRESHSTGKARRCRCTQSSCPFQRLHHLLKEFPFPGKQLLQHKDAHALQQRRTQLEHFLVRLQEFFCGYPRSFLETTASTQRCEVLSLVSAFTGMDTRPGSFSVIDNPFTLMPERVRYYSHCFSPPASPSSSLLSDTTDGTHLSEDRGSDNQREHFGSSLQERLSHASIRSSTVLSSSSSLSLPQLHVKSANVETYQASLDSVRDNLLQQMGADVQQALEQKELTDEEQWALALRYAAERGLYADVVTILRRGTIVNCTVLGEATPLYAASGSGQAHVVQCLLAHDAAVDQPGPVGMTPLMNAVNNSQLETAKLLLRAGANVNLCNNRNVSPVHLAVVNNSMPMLLLLLDHGATVDVPNSVNGRTPLHVAADAGSKEMCDVLVKYGARLSQCSPLAKSAAADQGRWRVQELCNEYRRTATASLLEAMTQDSPRERTSSNGRMFCAPLKYVDNDEDERRSSQAKEDIAMVAQDGRIYAVL